MLEKINHIRRAVIEAKHGLPYDEAIKKEVSSGCLVSDCKDRHLTLHSKNDYILGNDTFHLVGEYYDLKSKESIISFYKILGHPPTLAGVMEALCADYNSHIFKYTTINPRTNEVFFHNMSFEYICRWQLHKNGKEQTLDQQTPETITAIYNLLKN